MSDSIVYMGSGMTGGLVGGDCVVWVGVSGRDTHVYITARYIYMKGEKKENKTSTGCCKMLYCFAVCSDVCNLVMYSNLFL